MNIQLSPSGQEKLRALGVQSLYLFGSRAQGVPGVLSDYDFGLLMEKTGHQRGNLTYDQVYEILAPYCPRTKENDVIDIVFVRDITLELQFHIIQYGVVLFDTDPLARGRFEEDVMCKYCDYRPILDRFDQAILASL